MSKQHTEGLTCLIPGLVILGVSLTVPLIGRVIWEMLMNVPKPQVIFYKMKIIMVTTTSGCCENLLMQVEK